MTVAAIEVPLADSRRYGVLEVDAEGRVIGFREKPEAPPAAPWSPGACLGSMGVYIFDTDVLVRELQRDAESSSSHDFGRDIIPRLVSTGERVFAYLFWDENKKEAQYWRDVGTIDAYFEASMDLIQVDPVFNLYDPQWPLRTYQPQLPPAKFVFAEDGRRGVATQSVVSMGCIVSGSEVRRSVLCPDVRVHSLLRGRGRDPAARRRGEPPQPRAPRHHRPRASSCRAARSSATTPPRTVAATPCRPAASSS